MVSVPEPASPTETRLPSRSATVVMPLSADATNWVKLVYRMPMAHASMAPPSNSPVPAAASEAVSPRTKAISDWPEPMRFMLSTDAFVSSAVAV